MPHFECGASAVDHYNSRNAGADQIVRRPASPRSAFAGREGGVCPRVREADTVQHRRNAVARYRIKEIADVDLEEVAILNMPVQRGDMPALAVMIKAVRQVYGLLDKPNELLRATIAVVVRREIKFPFPNPRYS
jgi:hypothetical protein